MLEFNSISKLIARISIVSTLFFSTFSYSIACSRVDTATFFRHDTLIFRWNEKEYISDILRPAFHDGNSAQYAVRSAESAGRRSYRLGAYFLGATQLVGETLAFRSCSSIIDSKGFIRCSATHSIAGIEYTLFVEANLLSKLKQELGLIERSCETFSEVGPCVVVVLGDWHNSSGTSLNVKCAFPINEKPNPDREHVRDKIQQGDKILEYISKMAVSIATGKL